jgi:hypothetical protein
MSGKDKRKSREGGRKRRRRKRRVGVLDCRRLGEGALLGWRSWLVGKGKTGVMRRVAGVSRAE